LANINFGNSQRAVFPTKYHGNVTLSKAKWGTICSAPERRHYPFNGDKVATTLINPDLVRHHRTEPTQFFYYKKFVSMRVSEIHEVKPLSGAWLL